MNGIRRSALALAALAVAVFLFGCSPAPLPGATVSPNSRGAVQSSASPHASAPMAVAIGDSIAIGYGVPPEDAWPLLVAQQLGWSLTDLGESGAGFVTTGANTHTFDAQVNAAIVLRPEIVVIAGTRNDRTVAPATLTSRMNATLQRLAAALPETTIISIGPIWGADDAPPRIAEMSAELRSAIRNVGGQWIEIGQPLQGRSDLVLSDAVHPTVRGQQAIADAVVKQISTLGK